jgi:WD40 repeat protein
MPESEWLDITELEWSRNGRWLLASGGDGNFRSRSIIRLYDATTGETMRTIFPGINPIWGPNDEQFAGLSISADHYVINIWDVDTGEVLSTFEAHENGTFAMSWNFRANVIAGADIEDHLIVWDVETGMRYDIEDVQTHLVGRGSVEWRPDSNQLAIADHGEGVVIL